MLQLTVRHEFDQWDRKRTLERYFSNYLPKSTPKKTGIFFYVSVRFHLTLHLSISECV